jgi:hypothetical protein
MPRYEVFQVQHNPGSGELVIGTPVECELWVLAWCEDEARANDKMNLLNEVLSWGRSPRFGDALAEFGLCWQNVGSVERSAGVQDDAERRTRRQIEAWQ